jgi:hypothetical protein
MSKGCENLVGLSLDNGDETCFKFFFFDKKTSFKLNPVECVLF